MIPSKAQTPQLSFTNSSNQLKSGFGQSYFHYMLTLPIEKNSIKFTNPKIICKIINKIMQIIFQLARCTHYGIRSWFRGLTPYFLKTSIPYTVYHMSESSLNLNKFVNIPQKLSFKKDQIIQLTKAISLCVSYTLIYPFQNIRLRMGSDVERSRVYKNIRDCIQKMNKIQGKSSFYRGYLLSLPYILFQYFSAVNLYKYLLSKQNEQNFPSLLKTENGFSLFLISYLATQIFLYPFDSIRKNIQINGALNHNNIYNKYRDVIKFNSFIKLYRGLGYKLISGLAYSAVIIGLEKNRDSYY